MSKTNLYFASRGYEDANLKHSSMPAKIHLIGIAGPSCAGKGTLAAWIAQRLPAEILPIDAYYRPLDHVRLQDRAFINFDDPASIDNSLLQQHLESLIAGNSVDRPIYDFAHHTRKQETVPLMPSGFLLIEGLFTFCWPRIRELLTAAIFITAPDDICLDRRVDRDQRERGRTEESVRGQYSGTVQPMRYRFVDPTTVHAGLTLDGTKPLEENGQKTLDFILQATAPDARSHYVSS